MPPKKKAQKPSNKTEQKKKDKIIEVMYSCISVDSLLYLNSRGYAVQTFESRKKT